MTDWGKKVRPGTFGMIKVGQREYPKSPSVKKHLKFAATPSVLTPSSPFSNVRVVRLDLGDGAEAIGLNAGRRRHGGVDGLA